MTDEMILYFKDETRQLLDEMNALLEEIEGDYSQVKRLETYGQLVDRIMGGAASLGMMLESDELKASSKKIAAYAEICKSVGYKGSQVTNNETFYNVVVGLLLDATEVMQELTSEFGSDQAVVLTGKLTDTFLERLKWVSQHFQAGLRASIAIARDGQNDSADQNGATSATPDMDQAMIDALLKQLADEKVAG